MTEEAEGAAAAGVMVMVAVAHEMLYAYRLLEWFEQEVELPLILEMNNIDAVDLATTGASEGEIDMWT